MLELSIKSLVVGVGLACLLAIAANLLALPAWSIYVAFVAIIAVSAYISAVECHAHTGLPRRRRGPGA